MEIKTISERLSVDTLEKVEIMLYLALNQFVTLIKKVYVMQILTEISMYPLSRDYDQPIHAFIQKLKSHQGIEVTPGETSTVIRGEYQVVMDILRSEVRSVLDSEVRTAFVVKLMNTV
jgi:uncharacterized protein YqgV (UPF0045/DUF77 family)